MDGLRRCGLFALNSKRMNEGWWYEGMVYVDWGGINDFGMKAIKNKKK